MIPYPLLWEGAVRTIGSHLGRIPNCSEVPDPPPPPPGNRPPRRPSRNPPLPEPPPSPTGLRPTVSWGGSWRPKPRGRLPRGANIPPKAATQAAYFPGGLAFAKSLDTEYFGKASFGPLILILNHRTLLPIFRHHLGHIRRVHRKVVVMGQLLQGQGQGRSHRLMPHRMQRILMLHCSHPLKVVSQVVWNKAVTVHQTRRLWGQRVRVGTGKWFCPSKIIFHARCSRGKLLCHRGWSPLPSPLQNLLRKLPNLVPHPQQRMHLTPAAQTAAKPAAGAPISVAPVEHVQLFRVKHFCQKKWHTEPVPP